MKNENEIQACWLASQHPRRVHPPRAALIDCSGDGAGGGSGAEYRVGRERKANSAIPGLRGGPQDDGVDSVHWRSTTGHAVQAARLARFPTLPHRELVYSMALVNEGAGTDTSRRRAIRDELLATALGIWDLIKSSGHYPDENGRWSGLERFRKAKPPVHRRLRLAGAGRQQQVFGTAALAVGRSTCIPRAFLPKSRRFSIPLLCITFPTACIPGTSKSVVRGAERQHLACRRQHAGDGHLRGVGAGGGNGGGAVRPASLRSPGVGERRHRGIAAAVAQGRRVHHRRHEQRSLRPRAEGRRVRLERDAGRARRGERDQRHPPGRGDSGEPVEFRSPRGLPQWLRVDFPRRRKSRKCISSSIPA